MEILYAPWRTNYVASKKNKKKHKCVFCDIVNDKKNKKNFALLHVEKDFFIVMNKFPYTPGHFMIIPNLHTSKLEDLDAKIWAKMNIFAQKSIKLLKDTINAHGVNIGMNLGQAGGAGIAEHIHMHIIPRWIGDTNFMTTLGKTRIYSTDFDKIYNKLKKNSSKYFNNINYSIKKNKK